MSTPLVLFLHKQGKVILSPNHRYCTVISFDGSHIRGRILDRDRGNVVLEEVESENLLVLLASLVARGLGKGIFRAPQGATRIGVRYGKDAESFGCYVLDASDEPEEPIVAVDCLTYWATVRLGKGSLAKVSPRNTREETMLTAVAVFMANSLAA